MRDRLAVVFELRTLCHPTVILWLATALAIILR